MAWPESDRGAYHGSYWDDLRAPATGITITGLSAPPDTEADTGLLLFDGGTTETINVAFQMPHAWAEGTTVYPHVHWAKTTSAAGDVNWTCRSRMHNIGDVVSTYTSITQHTTSVITDDDTAWQHLITSLEPIDMTGMTLSCMVYLEIGRLGGSDSYAADARLLEVDMHYEINQPGSVRTFEKYPAGHEGFYFQS